LKQIYLDERAKVRKELVASGRLPENYGGSRKEKKKREEEDEDEDEEDEDDEDEEDESDWKVKDEDVEESEGEDDYGDYEELPELLQRGQTFPVPVLSVGFSVCAMICFGIRCCRESRAEKAKLANHPLVA